jgi:RNA polymerase sigma factor (sigma-70 family)
MWGDDEVAGSGDEAAAVPVVSVASFEETYRASYAPLTRVAHLLTGSNEVAEEVVQDAFVALYPRFDTVDNPGGYLYRSVVNGCRGWARRRVTRDRVTRDEQPAVAAVPELDETWTALAGLSERKRAIVVLRFYADLPLAEIGELLGCRTGTVKSQLHRALHQLGKVIER